MKTEIWDVLEQDDFAFKSLLVLENLQVLESYLWPGYTEDSRLPVTRQRDHQEGMRSVGLYFDLAQYVERKEAGPEAGSEPAIEKGLESCGKAIRRR